MVNNASNNEIPIKYYKVIVAGDGAVGKTTLSKRLAGTLREDEVQKMTFGVDFHKIDMINDRPTYAFLWDLGGQDQFRHFQDQFFHAAHIVILIYSVEWFHSFINLSTWLKYVKEEQAIKIYLIANKIDSPYRAITREEGMDFAATNKMTYYEVSALYGTGILDFKRDFTSTINDHGLF
ncbi:MAG: GTP-binding protein [Candidatus Lokiarchaeota archaeon]|nr:GTP-binding protein [Candidatus Lokiarchaeota archaeon]